MNKNIKLTDQWISRFRFIVLATFSLLVISCSQGLRLKNLVNYPVTLFSLSALDTLKIPPDVVKYLGNEETTFRRIETDLRIQGRQVARPVWQSELQGCFAVGNGANVHIQDFNFKGSSGDTVLIRIDSGRVILENCDVSGGDAWSIQVGLAGDLELRNVRFTDNGSGAIKLDGGQVKIYNSEFDQAGETAIYAASGSLLEAHEVILTNTMGTAFELNSVSEVWLDSVKVIDSFQDGISLQNCDFVLISQVESRGNGRHGLRLRNATISGLLNYSAIGNLVHGMVIENVDTLRVVNSEFVGNGENGALIHSADRNRMAGVRVEHNGSSGFQITGGQELLIHHSSFQANPTLALGVDSLASVQIKHTSIMNNGTGLRVNHFADVELNNNLLVSNKASAASFKHGTMLVLTMNLLKENQLGYFGEDILNVQLDSNRVESNELGGDFRSVARLTMTQNIWKNNGTSGYFSQMGSIVSNHDQWISNHEHAFEILAAEKLILSNSVIKGNRNAGLLNQVSAKLEGCVFDSSSGYALKVMNGSLVVHDSRFESNKVGIDLNEGSRAQIVQSQFVQNELAINARASVSLSMSFCEIHRARAGLTLGNYVEAEILSNHFDEIDDYSIRITGPHLQRLYLRQNVISRTGGIIKSLSSSGTVDVISNTFAHNGSGFQVQKRSIDRLDHNIFFQTYLLDPEMMKDLNQIKSNCFYPQSKQEHPAVLEESNHYLDPQFDDKYYLTPRSPCLQDGKNGLLIGALGTIPEKRPILKP
ncbi:MAG: right-handed parallel beta-helix repeat-containing protein [Candidatus Marinimicrobia bacterium]|nr:right-handed parallel beta-helix repeat-containing protein [Candidatus Neomarinimicrobiota bacterium]